MACTEGRYAALGGEISTSQVRRSSKRLRGEGVSTSAKAGPASDTGPSSARKKKKKKGVEEVQSDGGERDIIIKRQHFPADPPKLAPFAGKRSYEKFIRPYLGMKITATDELDASARKSGYKNYVDGYCFQLVDI